MFRRTAPLANFTQIVVQFFGPDAKYTGIVGWEQPVLQEVAKEELVPGDVPEQKRSPLFEIATVLGQDDERAIPSGRIEPAVQHLGNIAKPGHAACADEVFVAKAVKVLSLRTGEIPRS